MLKIEHIGIAVKDLDASCSLYEKLLGQALYKRETVASEGVETAFFLAGEQKVELLGALHAGSPVASFLSARGEGIHHLAFAVDDILAEMERLKAAGFRLLSETPRKGADNKLICFVHPKDAGGVLVELCQEIAAEAPAPGA